LNENQFGQLLYEYVYSSQYRPIVLINVINVFMLVDLVYVNIQIRDLKTISEHPESGCFLNMQQTMHHNGDMTEACRVNT